MKVKKSSQTCILEKDIYYNSKKEGVLSSVMSNDNETRSDWLWSSMNP